VEDYMRLERRSPAQQSKGSVVAWVLPAIGLGVTATVWLVDLYDDLRHHISTNAECCVDYKAYQLEDSGQRHFWVGVIEAIRESQRTSVSEIAKLQAMVDQLRTDARSRPDPFTGSDGKRLEAAIDSLEKRIERLETSTPR
jgi:hypothetical protein